MNLWRTIIGVVAAAGMLVGQAKAPGVVHIYRTKLNQGKAVHPSVACDNFPVAKIQNGRIYTMKVSAGRHNFTVGDSPNGIDVDVESGKEYFVRIDFPANASFATGASPVQVPADQGSKETRALKPLDGWYIEAATCGKP